MKYKWITLDDARVYVDRDNKIYGKITKNKTVFIVTAADNPDEYFSILFDAIEFVEQQIASIYK